MMVQQFHLPITTISDLSASKLSINEGLASLWYDRGYYFVQEKDTK
jgi:hypothetical protein